MMSLSKNPDRLLLVMAVTAFVLSTTPSTAQDQPAIAEEPSQSGPSGFERIRAYNAKLLRFREFQTERGLKDVSRQNRTSQAVADVQKIIGGLETLMREEAERLYEKAMSSEDPQERDRILKAMAAKNNLPSTLDEFQRRAEAELAKRTVAGFDEPFPTVEEALQAKRKQQGTAAGNLQEIDKQDLQALTALKQELLTEKIRNAATRFANQEAHRELDLALRLVPSQRPPRIEDVIRNFPKTEAADKAEKILSNLKANTANQVKAGRRLEQAKAASTLFDQRWRRLMEIRRDYPHTEAADQAEKLVKDYAETVPPMTFRNDMEETIEFTVDVPFRALDWTKLESGKTHDVSSIFPATVRVDSMEGSRRVYRVQKAKHYVFRKISTGEVMLFALPSSN